MLRSTHVVYTFRNFVIKGAACQPPSNLRKLQATPPLQTSLVYVLMQKIKDTYMPPLEPLFFRFDQSLNFHEIFFFSLLTFR